MPCDGGVSVDEDLEKMTESDPLALDARKNDNPGSFLDLYRSIDVSKAHIDAEFVDKAVIGGVVPESIRYGIMRRNSMEAYRGVVKSTRGTLHYFNWCEGGEFKLVKADTQDKAWEADKLYRSCALGCDLRKSEMIEEDDEDAEKAKPATTNAVSEEQWMKEQQRTITDVHPGAAGMQMPDDPAQGQDWHAEPLTRATDGAPITHNGPPQWTALDLVKAWGQKIKQSVPKSPAESDPLASEYMRTVLGMDDRQIRKSAALPARHRLSFEKWKADRIQNKMDGLQKWIKGH